MVSVWLTIWPIFSSFQLVSPIFSTLFQIWLKLPPSFNCKYPSMCVHTSHRPYEYSFLMLCSWQWVHRNSWCSFWHLCSCCVGCWLLCEVRTITCAFFKHVQFFLLMSRHGVHRRWHSNLNQCCHCQPNTSRFTSSILCHPRICCFWYGSSQKKQSYYNSSP